MKKLVLIFGFSMVFISQHAFAAWVTNSEDDVFSGGQKATLVATLNDYNADQALIFDCTKDSIKFSYVEKSADLGKMNIPVKMVVKVDSNKIINIDGHTDSRNSDYSEISTTDKDAIIGILREAASAKTKIILGLSVPDIEVKQSYTANVSGSRGAISKFAAACELKI